METKSFAAFLESCKDPHRESGNQLCRAYTEIHGFYLKLIPDAAQSPLSDAFAAYYDWNKAHLCRALTDAGELIQAIALNGTHSKFYQTLTNTEYCERRCTELNDDTDQFTVRPICKVIAHELQLIGKQKAVEEKKRLEETKNQAATGGLVAKQEPPPMAIQTPSAVVVVPTANKPAPGLPLAPVLKPKPPTSATQESEEKKKPASITPGTNPQLAEDVQPLANQKVSTSTVDYSNVLVPNNNEPDDNIKLSLDTVKQSPPQSPAIGDGGADNKPGGSLDDDQGGQLEPADDPFMDNNDDGDYGLEEKLPEKSNVEKEKSKPVAEGETIKEEKLPVPSHNKKPTQVGDSFEVEGRLEEINHRGKMTEMIDDPFYEETDSNFFAYFLFLMAVCVLGYVAYHNKKKVLALLLEGRRGSTGRGGGATSGSRRSRGGSRKHTAAYQKLDSNLEEAITSTGQSRTSQIIY